MNMRTRCGRWLAFGSALAAPALAHAEDFAARDPVAAEALFDAGKALLKSGDWLGGCTKFERSMSLDPAVSTLVKIAKCREHEGKLATAWYEYQRAIKLNREVTASEHRRLELDAFIVGEVDQLTPRVPKLRVLVVGPPGGGEATRDGILIALGEMVPVDPGEHVILARAAGFVEQRQIVALTEGQQRSVEFQLAPALPQPPPAAPARPTAAPASPPRATPIVGPALAPVVIHSSHSAQRDWGFLATGAGGAGLLVAALLEYRTVSLVHDSNPECAGSRCSPRGDQMRSDARTEQAFALTSAIVGVVGVGVGLLLIGTHSDHKPQMSQVALGIGVGPLSVRSQGAW